MTATWRDHPLAIRIVDDSSFNACAKRLGRSYEIDIHRGAVEHIVGAFHSLLSCPSFLPQVGTTSLESTPECILNAAHIIPLPIRRSENAQWDSMPYPNDKERQQIALQLATMALQFLVFHEVGHIVAGHLELKYGRAQYARMAETESVRDDDGGLSWACECDADFFATHVTNWVDTNEKMASLTHKTITSGAWTPAQAAQIIHMVSVGTLFRINYPDAPLDVQSVSGTHPHPAVRSAATCAYSVALTLNSKKLALNVLNELYLDSLVNLENTWAELHLRGQITDARERWAATVLDGMNGLLKTLSMYREDLTEHAHLHRAWDYL